MKNKKDLFIKDRERFIRITESDWAHQVAESVLKFFPEREVYTCAAGISPSGSIHFGNLRDIMTSLAVKRRLEMMGKKTRFIFSWDDLDRFRKVPDGFDIGYMKYIGYPLSSVPDLGGKEFSYALFFEKEFEETMREFLGDEIEYRYQTKEYLSGRYNGMMMLAIKERKKIAKIILDCMTEKGKERKGIEEDSFIESYYPISVYSKFTGTDNTKIVHYNDEGVITYYCKDVKKEDVIDFRSEYFKGDALVKLKWKPDWAMRWKEEGVNFEPGGHDHASPGGSFDVSSRIAKEVFDCEPPVFVEYKFVGIRGLDGKMSGSKGNAVTPGQLLEIYEPALLEWLYFKHRPNQEFKLAFDTDIYRQYDEFDKAVRDYRKRGEDSDHASFFRLVSNLSAVDSDKDVLPFRQAVSFGQILQWDLNKMKNFLFKFGFDYSEASIKVRLKKARNWLEKFNPEEIIKVRDSVNIDYLKKMDEKGKIRIKLLCDQLAKVDTEKIDQKDLEQILYGVAKSENLSEDDLKKEQRKFFKDVYNLLMENDTGPRLSTFIWAIGKEKVLDILDI